MKKHLLLFTLILFMGLTQVGWGQLLVENFDYTAGTDLSTLGWSVIGTNTTPDCVVSSSGLTYADYAGSGVGLGANLTASGDESGKGFTSQNSGSIYYSFLVNVSSATTAGTYFTGLTLSATSTTFTGRVYAKVDASSNLAFGITKTTEAVTYTSFVYSLNTTYLVVLKYTFVASTTNDQVSLFVLTSPTLPSVEPTADIGPLAPSTADPSSLAAVFLRQGTSGPSAIVDGIRVGTQWGESALPVELTSFSALTKNKTVNLTWKTATEVNNYGFEVQRSIRNEDPQKAEGIRNWNNVGFVNGNGNSNSAKEYNFADRSVSTGKYLYRLKQLDNDGQYEYSKEIEVDLGMPMEFSLGQNYPNPFNPSTSIQYSVVSSRNVVLKIFNVIGKEVAVLVNEKKEPGTYTVDFSAANLASGTYLYRLQAGEFVQTKKMVILK